jgi:hypothetical protein
MRMLTRASCVVVLALILASPRLTAQSSSSGSGSFQWYIGPQIGTIIFETPNQTRGAVVSAGGHMLITAKRTGLFISVDEGITTNQVSSFADATAPAGASCSGSVTGARCVTFNDLRKYSFVLMAFPLKSHFQPFIGIGWGIMQTVKNYPSLVGTVSASEVQAAQDAANSAGSYGFGTAVGGVQVRVSKFALFGQYQITTNPGNTKLLVGPTHTFQGGIRFSLGPSREAITDSGL